MQIKFSPPDITELEIEETSKALKSGWITTGPKTKEFEKMIATYCGAPKAVCLNSATAALELTLKILGIGPGDEVITSAYTYTASASVISHVGATIKLVDTLPDSYEMDYAKLAGAITSKTKAVIPVDLGGVMCDYDKIFETVKSATKRFSPSTELQKLYSRVVVIADAAHSFGSSYKGIPSGNIADFTCFSFHAVKNLTTAEGGAAVWKNIPGLDNENLYKEFMLWALHGQNKDALAKTVLGSWEYDIVYLGHKCNMTDIAAGVGIAQLKRYPSLLSKRKEIAGAYDNLLLKQKVSTLVHTDKNYGSNCHLYLTRVNGINESQRNDIIRLLAQDGIAANVHYKPLPMFTAYKKLGFDIKNYPNAYNQYCNEITLPLHTLLTNDEVEYVIKKYNNILESI